MCMQSILQIESLHKSFPGTHVLKGINLDFEQGKIYSLVGENGAGKSTLVKILMGLYKPDSGTIKVNGEIANLHNPIHARKRYKIDAVFQEHSLIPQLSIAENIAIDELKLYRKGALLDFRKLEEHAKRVLENVGLDLDVTKKVELLSEREKSLIELAKVVAADSNVIILDEITAALEFLLVDKLMSLLERLKSQGKTFIFISHRMEEVLRYSDEIFILKDGNLAGKLINKEKQDNPVRRREIIRMMTGLASGLSFPPKQQKSANTPMFTVQGLCSPTLFDINLEVREGEIVCLTGLGGQGQSNLLRTITGILPKRSGTIKIHNREIKIQQVSDAMNAGIIYISDQRDDEEIWGSHNILFNMVLPSLPKRTKCGVINKRKETQLADRMVDSLSIETTSLNKLIRYLSGGNRQKIVLARYLLAKPKILILDQPTVGLDIATKIEIYQLLRELTKEGVSTLVLFTEREEVLGVPDRLVVMCEGRIVKEFDGASVVEEELLSSYYK